jgi:hypothetical protein
MQSPQQRKRERENKNKADRKRRKQAKAPIIVEVMIGGFTVTAPLFEVYAPIFARALSDAEKAAGKVETELVLQDRKLLEMAQAYNIPLTQEQAFLVQEGDTFLPQFEKVQIDTEKQMELLGKGYSPLSSSNIAAVRIDGADLLILFHSGDEYRYPNKAEMYYPFNEALSPGRLLHRTIRFAKGYSKE